MSERVVEATRALDKAQSDGSGVRVLEEKQ